VSLVASPVLAPTMYTGSCYNASVVLILGASSLAHNGVLQNCYALPLAPRPFLRVQVSTREKPRTSWHTVTLTCLLFFKQLCKPFAPEAQVHQHPQQQHTNSKFNRCSTILTHYIYFNYLNYELSPEFWGPVQPHSTAAKQLEARSRYQVPGAPREETN
jgi:hypothetical protein